MIAATSQPWQVGQLYRTARGAVRVDRSLLYPAFARSLEAVLERCHARGHDYYVTSGTRLYDAQAALYERHLKGGPRASPPGLSAHQYGLAVDVAPDGSPAPGLQPDYSPAAYQVLAEEVRVAGLTWGGDFRSGRPDRPHVQWPGYVTGAELRPLRELWLATPGTDDERLRAVWARVGG